MRPPTWLFGVVLPALAGVPTVAAAQEARGDPAAQADAAPLIILPPAQPASQPQHDVAQAQPDSCGLPSAGQQDQQKQGKSGLVEDAGSAAASQGGAIAGGAVAGPIGAAVGGVLVDHVGRAIKNVFFGKKRDPRQPSHQDCEQQASADDNG